MNKQEALNILRYGSRESKLEYLNDLDTAFDTYNRDIANASEVVGVLIDAALASTDDEITDGILEVICSAQVSQNLHGVDYDALAGSLDNVAERFLPRFIDILGNTGDKRYLSAILRFQNHQAKNVQNAVKDALVELRVTEHK